MALRHQAESPKQAHPGDILLVIHAFEARSPDELSLIKGERIELIEKDDDFGDGWYLGKHTIDGRTGLFPEGACSFSRLVARANANFHNSIHQAGAPSASRQQCRSTISIW
jgi:hypothetical protein